VRPIARFSLAWTFVVSHPFRKRREMDGTRLMLHSDIDEEPQFVVAGAGAGAADSGVGGVAGAGAC
jgi:hypothetical protein